MEPSTIQSLSWPEFTPDVVIDTDTYNEIDDQFALVYCLLAGDRMNLKAIYATPFHNKRSTGPQDGMEKSYEEIHRVLNFMDKEDVCPVLKGSKSWLGDPAFPVKSPAAEHLIATARKKSPEHPLYVIAIGAITNVVSAILMAPEIAANMVVLWLGGNPLNQPNAREFNLSGDLLASQTLFNLEVPLILFPCRYVVEQLRTTEPELNIHLRKHGRIGNYLYEIFRDYEKEDLNLPGASKTIWDLAPVAWLLNSKWFLTRITQRPTLTSDRTWAVFPDHSLIREILHVRRDDIFTDFFARVKAAAPSSKT